MWTANERASDSELLLAVADGSEPAFTELRNRYRRAVERACRSIIGRDAEDCAQEVFTRVWRKAPLYDGRRGGVPAWLMTVARRTALNLRAATASRRETTFADTPTPVQPPDTSTLWLQEALAQLPQQQRQVIELAYFDDLTQSSIAAQLAVPLGTVKSWTRRGLNQLAVTLEAETK